LAGGMNLYGFAGGDPVTYSDPFGLCPGCGGSTYGLFSGVWDLAVEKAKDIGNALLDLTPIGDANRSVAAFGRGDIAAGVGYGVLAAVGSIPGGEEAVVGSKFAVRAGLSKLGLGDDVVKGVRGVLSSGAGQEWGVRAAEGGGAIVNRFVQGKNKVSSVLWTYVLDGTGAVTSTAKQAYEATGAIPGTLKRYP
jgi:hypothetical protein